MHRLTLSETVIGLCQYGQLNSVGYQSQTLCRTPKVGRYVRQVPPTFLSEEPAHSLYSW